MPEINKDTIPGVTALPTWAIITTIVVLFVALMGVFYRWLADKDAVATKGDERLTKVLEGLGAASAANTALATQVKSLADAMQLWMARHP